MAQTRRKNIGGVKKKRLKKRKVNIVLTQKAAIVRKNDNIKAAQPDTIRKAPAKLYPDNGANFKIRIRKKS